MYPAANLIAPGVVQVVEGKRFTLGELDGTTTPRVQAISASLRQGRLQGPDHDDIRSEIWLKLWGNLSFNPISALTHATLVDICQFPLTRELASQMMREAETIANKLGITFRVSIDEAHRRRGEGGRAQDVDAAGRRAGQADRDRGAGRRGGRAGPLTGTPTPHIDAVYACASLLAKTLNAQHGKLAIEFARGSNA